MIYGVICGLAALILGAVAVSLGYSVVATSSPHEGERSVLAGAVLIGLCAVAVGYRAYAILAAAL